MLLKRLAWITTLLLLSLVVVVAGLLYLGPISSPKLIWHAIIGKGIDSPAVALVKQRLQAAPGFSVNQYASDLPAIRFLAFSRAGDLLVSQPRHGKVLLLKRDGDGDGRPGNHSDAGPVELLSGLTRPHGLEFYRQWLYVAESDAIGRVAFDHERGQVLGDYERLVTGLSYDGNHWTKSLRIKDDYIYVSSGSTCNVCEESDNTRAAIMRFAIDGSDRTIFASGLRNSVGLDFAPWDGALYATDNGRDMLGDDYPVCELNKIEQHGFYGWPYINGFGDPDPDLGIGQHINEDKQALLARAISPVFGFRAHNAPLGMTFVRNGAVSEDFGRSALVALHGSWNRSKPDGYKVVSLHWDDNDNISSRDFLRGFELDGNFIGRPVDVAEGPDRCFYVSDDFAGAVYRVCHASAR